MVEDLSRLYRNPLLQYEFVFFCVDNGVRFVSIADNLDTFDEYWESNMSVAALRHSMPAVDARRQQAAKLNPKMRHMRCGSFRKQAEFALKVFSLLWAIGAGQISSLTIGNDSNQLRENSSESSQSSTE